MNIINLIHSNPPDEDNYFELSHETETKDVKVRKQNKVIQLSTLQKMERTIRSDTVLSIEDACILSRYSDSKFFHCTKTDSNGKDFFVYNNYVVPYLYRLLQNIPIYIVTTNMSEKTISFPLNWNGKVRIPNCQQLDSYDKKSSMKLLPSRYGEYRKHNEKVEKEGDFEGQPLYHRIRNEEFGNEIHDHLGVYQCESNGDWTESSPNDEFYYTKIECFHPQIFIWIDNIYKEIIERGKSANPRIFYLLFAQVIFHELMHALMDTYRQTITNPDISKIFSLEEEPLAEALSIRVMKEEWLDRNCYGKAFFDERIRPWPYNLYKVYNQDEALMTALTAWILIKIHYGQKNLLMRWIGCLDKDDLNKAYSEELEDAENILRQIPSKFNKLKEHFDITEEEISKYISDLHDFHSIDLQSDHFKCYESRLEFQHLRVLILYLGLNNRILI